MKKQLLFCVCVEVESIIKHLLKNSVDCGVLIERISTSMLQLIFKKFNVAEDDNTSSPKAEIGPAVNPEFDSSFAVTIN